MTIQIFDIGDTVKMQATFKDDSGDLSDPASVTLTVKDPDGDTSTPSVTKESTGVYYGTVQVDTAGTWRYRFESTGTPTLAEEGTFKARVSEVV